MPYKKLIETTMPVAAINAQAEREKTARGGQPSAVHIWWSRRPLAAARSALFASLVDDPAEHPELFPTQADQDAERERLVKLAEALVAVESAKDVELLKAAQKEILRCTDGPLPAVFDPFAGSGAIPVEAHRLGLSAEAADLNPVAAMITTVVSDIPTRFHDKAPVHPQEALTGSLPLPGAQGFAEDVRFYGEWMQKEALRQIGSMYSSVRRAGEGEELEVSAWIWARTVRCPNPGCDCDIPLSSSYDLARKKGSEAWVEPVVEGGKVSFRMHREPNPSAKGKPKVAQTAVFKCPACGEITPDAYIKECGTRHEITSQLIAVVADDGQKRLYLEPEPAQETAARVAVPKNIPHGALPVFPRRFSPPLFGLTDYADLFTDRQLVFITTMLKLAREAQEKVERRAAQCEFADDGIAFADGGRGALAYAQAIRITLMLTVSKLLDRCSNLCSWDASGGGSLRNVFSRAAMPMIWDYAEANPFADSSGSFASALERTCEAIAALPIGGDGHTIVADATMPNGIHNALLSTELPYYDKASYADLADFFYVWLRAGLSDLFPAFFQSEITSKKEELTAFPYRWNGDRQQANAFYAEGLNLAFKNLYASASEDYPSTVAFQYKVGASAGEWEAFVTAICNAGFVITASWPLACKHEENIELAQSRGIAITVVIRKRPQDAPQTTRRAFVAAVKRELPVIVEHIRYRVGIMELRASIIGQALQIYSRYAKVLDADGTTMQPEMASRIIEQELDMILASVYEAGQAKEEETDA